MCCKQLCALVMRCFFLSGTALLLISSAAHAMTSTENTAAIVMMSFFDSDIAQDFTAQIKHQSEPNKAAIVKILQHVQRELESDLDEKKVMAIYAIIDAQPMLLNRVQPLQAALRDAVTARQKTQRNLGSSRVTEQELKQMLPTMHFDDISAIEKEIQSLPNIKVDDRGKQVPNMIPGSKALKQAIYDALDSFNKVLAEIGDGAATPDQLGVLNNIAYTYLLMHHAPALAGQLRKRVGLEEKKAAQKRIEGDVARVMGHLQDALLAPGLKKRMTEKQKEIATDLAAINDLKDRQAAVNLYLALAEEKKIDDTYRDRLKKSLLNVPSLRSILDEYAASMLDDARSKPVEAIINTLKRAMSVAGNPLEAEKESAVRKGLAKNSLELTHQIASIMQTLNTLNFDDTHIEQAAKALADAHAALGKAAREGRRTENMQLLLELGLLRVSADAKNTKRIAQEKAKTEQEKAKQDAIIDKELDDVVKTILGLKGAAEISIEESLKSEYFKKNVIFEMSILNAVDRKKILDAFAQIAADAIAGKNIDQAQKTFKSLAGTKTLFIAIVMIQNDMRKQKEMNEEVNAVIKKVLNLDGAVELKIRELINSENFTQDVIADLRSLDSQARKKELDAFVRIVTNILNDQPSMDPKALLAQLSSQTLHAAVQLIQNKMSEATKEDNKSEVIAKEVDDAIKIILKLDGTDDLKIGLKKDIIIKSLNGLNAKNRKAMLKKFVEYIRAVSQGNQLNMADFRTLALVLKRIVLDFERDRKAKMKKQQEASAPVIDQYTSQRVITDFVRRAIEKGSQIAAYLQSFSTLDALEKRFAEYKLRSELMDEQALLREFKRYKEGVENFKASRHRKQMPYLDTAIIEPGKHIIGKLNAEDTQELIAIHDEINNIRDMQSENSLDKYFGAMNADIKDTSNIPDTYKQWYQSYVQMFKNIKAGSTKGKKYKLVIHTLGRVESQFEQMFDVIARNIGTVQQPKVKSDLDTKKLAGILKALDGEMNQAARSFIVYKDIMQTLLSHFDEDVIKVLREQQSRQKAA